MNKKVFIPVITENIPQEMEAGKLYINKNRTMSGHLCACGCKNKIANTLHPTKWEVIMHKKTNTVTLKPSVNVAGRFPCGSHYCIIDSNVIWCKKMTRHETILKRQKDREKVIVYNIGQTKIWAKLKNTLKIVIEKIRKLF